jgi:uncharacterized protein YggE
MKKYITIFALMISLLAFAQSTENKPIIAVTGESSVKVMPDYAIIKVRVEASSKSAADAKKKHDISVDAVLKFIKKMKIDTKDVATQFMNLNKVYDYNTKEYHYEANQSIQITLRDLNNYEKLLQGLFESGLNNIDGIHFASNDIEKHKSTARKLAIQNAQIKATEYARELNQSIGKAIIISEFQQNENPRFESKMMLDAVAVSNNQLETIAIGEIMVSAKVNVTFELK